MVLIPSGVQNVAKRLEPRRINAMRIVYKIKPDSSGFMQGTHFLFQRSAQQIGSSACADDDEEGVSARNVFEFTG
jgi:hypothetical protein